MILPGTLTEEAADGIVEVGMRKSKALERPQATNTCALLIPRSSKFGRFFFFLSSGRGGGPRDPRAPDCCLTAKRKRAVDALCSYFFVINIFVPL